MVRLQGACSTCSSSKASPLPPVPPPPSSPASMARVSMARNARAGARPATHAWEHGAGEHGTREARVSTVPLWEHGTLWAR